VKHFLRLSLQIIDQYKLRYANLYFSKIARLIVTIFKCEGALNVILDHLICQTYSVKPTNFVYVLQQCAVFVFRLIYAWRVSVKLIHVIEVLQRLPRLSVDAKQICVTQLGGYGTIWRREIAWCNTILSFCWLGGRNAARRCTNSKIWHRALRILANNTYQF
jgi:hypothetical protein